jgi:hypothetical protein
MGGSRFLHVSFVYFSFVLFWSARAENASHYVDSFTSTTLGVDDGQWQDWNIVWDVKEETDTSITKIRQQYQGGNETQRATTIEVDPKNNTNKVLKFRLSSPNVVSPVKGRVQTTMFLYGTANGRPQVNAMRLKHQFYLPASQAALRTYPKNITWLTVSEWWNNAPGLVFPFRITVGIWKYSPSTADVYFGVMAETYNETTLKWNHHLWRYDPTDFAVPFDQWMELDYYWKDGNADGRFFLAVDGVVICDHTGPTHDPANLSPVGLAALNPFKLYTSSELVDFMRTSGADLSFYFDDLQIEMCETCTNLDPTSATATTTMTTTATATTTSVVTTTPSAASYCSFSIFALIPGLF